MGDVAYSDPREVVAHPEPISVVAVWPWAVFAAALVTVIGLVAFGEGAFAHELLHDGRHLLAIPCD